MSYQRVIGLLAMTALMAGCGKESGNTNAISFRNGTVVTGTITLRNDEVTLHAPSAPVALINAAGDLSIDRRPTAVNAAQRALLQDYYRNVLAVNEHGIAAGMAGAAVAGQAIQGVLQGVVGGNTDHIDKEIHAKSQKVAQSALQTCQDLASIKAAQDSLAAQLAAFKPYAGIVEASSINDCEGCGRSTRVVERQRVPRHPLSFHTRRSVTRRECRLWSAPSDRAASSAHPSTARWFPAPPP